MAKSGRPAKWPTPNTSLANRLQTILPEKGLERLSQNYFGGVAKETTRKYLSGEIEPPLSVLLQICKDGNISPIYLIFGRGHYADIVEGLNDIIDNDGPGKILITDKMKTLPVYTHPPYHVSSNNITHSDFREIPFYPDEIAAGQPLNIRDNPEGIVVIHKDWCKNQQNMVAVRVSSTGTSMEPTIPAGAIVTIDTTPIDPQLLINKPVAIYKNNDGATIKRLRKTARGWCGVPDNRDPEHEIIIIEDGDRIIGKVNSVHYAL